MTSEHSLNHSVSAREFSNYTERPRIKGCNYHHLAWNKSWYMGRLENNFRESLVMSSIIKVHVNLHEEMGPPPKPTTEEMIYVLGKLATVGNERYDRIDTAIRAFDDLSLMQERERDCIRSMKISEHLYNQKQFMILGDPNGR